VGREEPSSKGSLAEQQASRSGQRAGGKCCDAVCGIQSAVKALHDVVAGLLRDREAQVGPKAAVEQYLGNLLPFCARL